MTILLAEGVIRLALFTPFLPIKSLGEPHIYASQSADDDYWRLSYLRPGMYPYPRPGMIQETLGWSQDRITAENPLGLHAWTREQMRLKTPKIFFYGDSFVKGSAQPKYWIPLFMTRQLKSTTVIDLGIGGSGMDQMYLLFQRTFTPDVGAPLVIVGTLMDDIDRTILTTRTYQKPRFQVEGRELKLTNVPIDANIGRFKMENSPKIVSYVGSAILMQLKRASSRLALFLERDEEKKQLVSILIEKFKEETRARGAPLMFVLFFTEWDVSRPTQWQETFIKQELERHGIPYVDTKPILKEYVAQQGVPLSKLYKPPRDGHHNDLGNEVVSRGILKRLREMGYR